MPWHAASTAGGVQVPARDADLTARQPTAHTITIEEDDIGMGTDAGRQPGRRVGSGPDAANTRFPTVPAADAGDQEESRYGAGPASQRESTSGNAERAGLTYRPPLEKICPSCGNKTIGYCPRQGCQ